MIAAAILGVVSLVALYMAFGRSFFGGTTTAVTVKVSPNAAAQRCHRRATRSDSALPSPDEQNFVYQTTPVVYNPGHCVAPDAGQKYFCVL